jgi:hypothetical protein
MMVAIQREMKREKEIYIQHATQIDSIQRDESNPIPSGSSSSFHSHLFTSSYTRGGHSLILLFETRREEKRRRKRRRRERESSSTKKKDKTSLHVYLSRGVVGLKLF